MTLKVLKEDNRFRVEWQGYSTDWLPDTISNRKAILVFLRLLQVFQNGNVKPLFTLQELSVLFGANSRQAASGHVERFRKCGSCKLRLKKSRSLFRVSETASAIEQTSAGVKYGTIEVALCSPIFDCGTMALVIKRYVVFSKDLVGIKIVQFLDYSIKFFIRLS